MKYLTVIVKTLSEHIMMVIFAFFGGKLWLFNINSFMSHSYRSFNRNVRNGHRAHSLNF